MERMSSRVLIAEGWGFSMNIKRKASGEESDFGELNLC
jgi:hypothetical protein